MNRDESMSSSGMSSSMSDQWVPLKDFENDYEVETEPPHSIRRKRDGRMLKLTLNKTLGYVIVSLNGEQYYYHRILAKHFIPSTSFQTLKTCKKLTTLIATKKTTHLKTSDGSQGLRTTVTEQ